MEGCRRRLASCAAALAPAVLACVAAAQQPGDAGTARPASAAAAGASGVASPGAAAGPGYAQRFAAVCASCHGANGRSDVPGTPVLAGQPSFYVITQLFLFREGRRDNEAMTAVAKGFTDNDLRGYSDYIGTLPAVPAPPPGTPPDEARMRQGQELAQQHKCFFCHGSDLAGGQQVPRIAQQHEQYLRASLRGFRTGTRPGYTQAMIGAVSHIPEQDLDALAYFAAHFTGPKASPTN
jgi:cytochrome c553